MIPRCDFLRTLGLAAAVALLPTVVLAAKVPKYGEYNPQHDTVEMFAAIDQGDIDVKLYPKDSTECNVLIENKSDKPLNVKLPAAFAAVPALAQAFGGGGGLGGGGGGGQTGGGGFGGMGGGGGFMNVPPEKVGKMKVPMVCLEHGKAEPTPKMNYEIRPIESFTDNKAVQELCAMVGSGQLPQRAAQVAAWHLSSGMSFQELMAKKLEFANGSTRPYFSPQEIRAGMQIVAAAVKKAKGEDADEEESLGSVSQR